MGRHRIPTSIKIANGNPGKRPLPIEPQYPPLSSICPPELQGEARAEWDRVVPELLAQGVVTTMDYQVVFQLCYGWGKIRELQTIIDRDGIMITNKNGDMQRHPADLSLSNALKNQAMLWGRLGLSPVDKTKINGNEVQQPKSDDEDWTAGYEVR